MKSCKANDKYYLTCERNWVYFTLICVAGFWGAYTYLLRGNIFCNAQTGNVVLMGSRSAPRSGARRCTISCPSRPISSAHLSPSCSPIR